MVVVCDHTFVGQSYLLYSRYDRNYLYVYRGYSIDQTNRGTDDASMTRFVMVCALLILVGCLGTCIYTSVMNLFEIHITPYVYIVKHLKDLVN